MENHAYINLKFENNNCTINIIDHSTSKKYDIMNSNTTNKENQNNSNSLVGDNDDFSLSISQSNESPTKQGKNENVNHERENINHENDEISLMSIFESEHKKLPDPKKVKKIKSDVQLTDFREIIKEAKEKKLKAKLQNTIKIKVNIKPDIENNSMNILDTNSSNSNANKRKMNQTSVANIPTTSRNSVYFSNNNVTTKKNCIRVIKTFRESNKSVMHKFAKIEMKKNKSFSSRSNSNNTINKIKSPLSIDKIKKETKENSYKSRGSSLNFSNRNKDILYKNIRSNKFKTRPASANSSRINDNSSFIIKKLGKTHCDINLSNILKLRRTFNGIIKRDSNLKLSLKNKDLTSANLTLKEKSVNNEPKLKEENNTNPKINNSSNNVSKSKTPKNNNIFVGKPKNGNNSSISQVNVIQNKENININTINDFSLYVKKKKINKYNSFNTKNNLSIITNELIGKNSLNFRHKFRNSGRFDCNKEGHILFSNKNSLINKNK